ncbi:MAG: putative dUTP diphosphatase [uncultured bacterium (gcode 4)]|uniref:dUTP diphosphatase n=1 Tax=uncultured bacterium (gcode 4) TaxID=1234023 RepID=K2AYA2_9BACT|nr:MAG: putative dUTP diphosphatase [uncultured bacterium (gcode 4)]
MKVRIKTSDWQALNYESAWACAFDFKCVSEITFAPGEFKLVETWVVVEVPAGYVLQTSPRSSTFKKFGLIQTNSIGIIDQDYCGDSDTIKFPFLNMRSESVTLEAGTRVGQWMFVKIDIADFEVVETMWNKDRWWFGSTGHK